MTVGMFGQGSRFFSVALLLYSPLGVSFALRVICSHGLVGLGTHGPNTVIKKKHWDGIVPPALDESTSMLELKWR